jgi:Cft2 family RNA processing exonuclease
MRYINFCSGSKGNCTYIESKETKLIIDCGSTKRYLSQSLHNWDIQLDSVDALLITQA